MIHQSHVYRQIKISQIILKKGHPRNIPVKLFQNLARGFNRRRFFKNFFIQIGPVVWEEKTSKQALVFTCLLYNSFENTAGKGEIARNEHFLLFLQCFLPV